MTETALARMQVPTENQLAEQFGTARDLKACIAIDVQFHHSLVEASGLRPLVAFGDLLVFFFQRFREAIRKVRSPPP